MFPFLKNVQILFKKTQFCNPLKEQCRNMGKKFECWLPICETRILKVPLMNGEKCRIASFIASEYFPHDPLMVAAGIAKQKSNASLLQYYLSALSDDKSIYAVAKDTNEILGVMISKTTTPQTVFALKRAAGNMANDEARRYMNLLAQVEERANVYKTYNVDKIWSVECVCTGSHYRRRGVAKLLFKGLKELLQEQKEYKLIKFATSNIYGTKAALNCGDMKAYSRRIPSTYKDDRGTPWVKTPLCSPHKNLEILIRNMKKTRKGEKKEPVCDNYGLEKYDKVE